MGDGRASLPWKARKGDGSAGEGQNEEQRVAEVRGILEKLQRISVDPPSESDAADWQSAPLSAADEANAGGHPAADAGSSRSVAGLHRPALLSVAALALAVVGAAALWRWGDDAPTQSSTSEIAIRKPPEMPAPASVQASQPPTPAIARTAESLTEAQKLIDAGQIQAGRRLLQGGLAGQSPDAALMLARSYDPNFLRTIAGADGGPDIAEAERWYRQWHMSASKTGLVMEPERLERIIRSMR
jgi:hypothetical protein